MSAYLGWAIAVLALAVVAYVSRRLRAYSSALQGLEKMNAKFEAELAERRDIERELAHMASFADMAPLPIAEINADGSIGYLNPAAEQKFPGITQKGKSHALFEGLDSAVELLRKQNKTLLTRPMKVSEKIYDQQISLFKGDPRIRLYMSDVTELKRLDQLKTDFVNMVSHELRSPLTTINASIRMVTAGYMGPVTADQVEALRLAEINIDRLTHMINDLLDISKVEAGKLELHRARMDLAAVVKDICRSFEPLAQNRGLQIRTQLKRDHIEILADRDKIVQILTNLLNNALKFTQKGYVEVSVSTTGNDVQCSVADTGPGISAEALPKVFTKFQQFGPVPNGREKGTGLGLSLCKGFVELHGGRIWVESRPQEGTQFIFVLPQLGSDDFFREKVRAALAETVASGKSLSLLRISLRDWKTFRQSVPEDEAIRVANQLQELVEAIVRSDADPVLQNEGIFELILAAADRTTSQEIAQRFRNTWRSSDLVKKSGLSTEVDIEIASYPDDGNAADQLIHHLNRLAA